MGKMIDAQSIVVATASTGQHGQEGRILRFVFWHSVALAAIMGVIVMLQAYVFPWMIPDLLTPLEVRLDVWLDVACLFKTRSEAQKACRGGKVDVNGQTAKPHRLVRVGRRARRSAGRSGASRRSSSAALADRHVAKAEARQLYEDLTPPPTAGGDRNAAGRADLPRGDDAAARARQRRARRTLRADQGTTA